MAKTRRRDVCSLGIFDEPDGGAGSNKVETGRECRRTRPVEGVRTDGADDRTNWARQLRTATLASKRLSMRGDATATTMRGATEFFATLECELIDRLDVPHAARGRDGDLRPQARNLIEGFDNQQAPPLVQRRLGYVLRVSAGVHRRSSSAGAVGTTLGNEAAESPKCSGMSPLAASTRSRLRCWSGIGIKHYTDSFEQRRDQSIVRIGASRSDPGTDHTGLLDKC